MTWSVPVDRDGAFVDGPGIILAGPRLGVLGDTRIAVKDVIDVAGRTTGAGNPTIATISEPALASAEVVARLVDAGATIVGRTVTDELAYSLSGTNVHLGTPRNIAWPGHEPGGSSSGSASAVASGAADLGIGTDTGGSIRVPASACRLLGWRPTQGAVSVLGVVPLAPTFDTVGLLARPDDAARLRRAADVVLDRGDPPAPVAGVVLAEELLAVLEEADQAAVSAAAERFARSHGVRAVRMRLLDHRPSEAAAAFRVLQGAEAWASHGALVSAGLELGPGIAARFEAASQVTEDQVAAAKGARTAIAGALVAATQSGWVIAQPAAAGPPVPLARTDPDGRAEQRGRLLELNAPAGLAGCPVVVLPARAPGEPPIGLALVGAPGADRSLLGAIEACGEVQR